MIRLLGAVLTITASLGVGVLYSLLLKKEYRVALGFVSLFRLIRARIECFEEPLHEIYGDFDDDALTSCGFTDALRESGFVPALARCRASLGLSEAMFSLLSEAGNGLGKSSTPEQIRHCDRYIALLEDEAAKMQSELPKRRKAAGALSSALGIMTAIALI